MCPTYRDIHHLEPVRVANEVIRQHDGSLEPRIRPFRGTGIGDVEPGDSDCLDLVGLLGDESLDGVLVVVVED